MIEAYKTEKFARYVPAKDVYDPPSGKLMYAGALIKKPPNAIVAPQVIQKKNRNTITSEGSVSCGSSDDGDNIIIIKAGALRKLEFEKNSDISNSDDDGISIKNLKPISVRELENLPP